MITKAKINVDVHCTSVVTTDAYCHLPGYENIQRFFVSSRYFRMLGLGMAAETLIWADCDPSGGGGQVCYRQGIGSYMNVEAAHLAAQINLEHGLLELEDRQ